MREIEGGRKRGRGGEGTGEGRDSSADLTLQGMKRKVARPASNIKSMVMGMGVATKKRRDVSSEE